MGYISSTVKLDRQLIGGKIEPMNTFRNVLVPSRQKQDLFTNSNFIRGH